MTHLRRGTQDVYVPSGDKFSWMCFFFFGIWGLFTQTWVVFWASVSMHTFAWVLVVLEAEETLRVLVLVVFVVMRLYLCIIANEQRIHGLKTRGFVEVES